HLRKDHCQAVCLLAARAAGRPDPEVLSVPRLEEPRHDLVTQEIPSDLVAEERGDVDEDRVEEVDELLGVLLQALEVGRISVDALRFHALGDPAREAGTLVTREVEAAVGSDELEEGFELAVLLCLLVHSVCTAAGSCSGTSSGTTSSSARRMTTPCSTAAFA